MNFSVLFFSTPARRWSTVLSILFVALISIVLFFPWNVLREPVNRYVSDQLGRRFEITRRLDVKLGLTSTVQLEGVELANPKWAKEPYLLKAAAARFEVKLWPLITGKVELPMIALTEPQIALQIDPDGRRTWALSRNTLDQSTVPLVGALLVDKGTLSYIASNESANVNVMFALEAEADTKGKLETNSTTVTSLPLTYKATGTWKGESLTAEGRTGGVLQFSKNIEKVFPFEINAVAGKTRLKAQGTVTNLTELGAVDATFDLQGQNLESLYRISGVVLPSTPPYKLRGKLTRKRFVWSAEQIQGVLGSSDLNGALSFDTTQKIPRLSGKLQSKVLDFADLAPVIGLTPSTTKSAKYMAGVSTVDNSSADVASVSSGSARRVLPIATLDLTKLNAMNADVVYSAADIRHVKALPLDKGSVHVKLQSGVLELTPISLGVAGGSMAGSIRVDSAAVPAAFTTQLDIRGMQFNKLFPTVDLTKNSLGKFSGQVDLKGRGNSVAQMLGSATGNVAMLMGRGEVSNILMEFLGLDGGEVIKFFLRGDRNIELKCAAAAFDVRDGLMTSRTILLDTSDTVINGEGKVNLANETIDMLLKPQPKDISILSLRSPLRLGGTFASPSAGPDKAALGERAGLALALGVINPLLALAATIETGPGQDADCAQALQVAAKGKATLLKATKAQPKR